MPRRCHAVRIHGVSQISLEWSLVQYPMVRHPVHLSIYAHLVFRFTILGIVIALFFKCMRALLNPVNRRAKVVKCGLVVHTAAMFVLVTIFIVLYTSCQRLTLINSNQSYGFWPELLPGPSDYWVGMVEYTPAYTYVLNQWLADGFLVSSVPCSVARVSNLGYSSALPMLHRLLHELLDHCLLMFDVPRLYWYV